MVRAGPHRPRLHHFCWFPPWLNGPPRGRVDHAAQVDPTASPEELVHLGER
jgi:hypothetical protein